MGLMQLMVQLGLNATGYETGLKRAQSGAQKFGNELSSHLGNKVTAAFGIAAIEEGFRKVIEYGGKIKDLNIRTGISTDDLQKFDYAAAKTGTSLDAIVQGVEKLGIAQAKARAGNTEMAATLQRLGLKPEQIDDLSNVPAHFVQIADEIKNTDVNGQVLKDMTEALGKSARELLPAFKEGLGEAGAEIEELGGIISKDGIEQLDKLGDRMTAFGASMKGTLGMVLGWAVTVWDGFFDGLATHLAGAIEFFNAAIHLKNPIEAYKDVWKASRFMREDEAKDQKQKAAVPAYEVEEDTKAAKAEKKELEDIARIHLRIDEIKRKGRLREMTDAEKVADLDRQIAAAQAEAAQMKYKNQEWADAVKNAGGNAAPVTVTALDEAKQQEKIAGLLDQRGQAEDKLDKKHDKTKALKKESGSSLIDMGNFLGLGDNPNRGVNEKLDVIHQDLVQIIKKDGSSRGVGVTFPV